MFYIYSPKKFGNFSLKSGWNRKKIAKTIGYAALAVFIFVVGLFAWFYKDLPSPNNMGSRFVVESTKIYDRTGEHLLYDIHGEEKRTQIPFSEMPDTLRYATISLEDQDFYNHSGIEFKGIIRAGLKDVFHMGVTQGGSTITQQLIKQSLLSSERTLARKIKEAILAIELEQKYTKDEVLAMYLNQIPYGSNAYGIEAAAQTYFGKHAKDLDLAQSAFLASLPQAPTYYSPYGSHPEALRARQMYALKQMKDLGYINEDQYNQAADEDVMGQIKPSSQNISAPHFVMYVKEYLEQKYGEQTVEQGGLKVYTTLDWDKQQAAEEAVKQGAENNKKYNAENASLVAMDPKTGQILAMVGSKDYFDTTIDGQVNVSIRNRQPGSSFKPYVYLTAFQKGYTPETLLWDVDTNFDTADGKSYNPKNYDGKNRGPVEMKNALAMSLNVPAVETLYLAGVKDSIDMAHKMGITTLKNPDDYGLSLVLGGGEVTLLDHVNAFSTFATGGIHHDKTAILKIEDSKGSILEQFQSNDGQRVVDEKYVSMIDYILSTNDLRAPVFGDNSPLRFDSRPVAAKTGTTNEWRDGWTVGYTPSLIAGVWAGNNDNSIMKPGSDGVYVAAPIWRAFMDKALRNYSIEQFPKYEQHDTGKDVLDGKMDPNSDNEVKVCKIPGKKDNYCLYSDACPDSTVDKKKFVMAHSILYYVKKDEPQGDPPSDPKSDPQFDNWEKAVKEWLKDNKDYKTAPDKQCESGDFKKANLEVKIKSPSNGDNITSPSFTIKVDVSSDLKVKKVSLSINGSEVKSSDNSFSYDYSVPDDKKSSDIKIEARVEDETGNSSSSSITVHTNIP